MFQDVCERAGSAGTGRPGTCGTRSSRCPTTMAWRSRRSHGLLATPGHAASTHGACCAPRLAGGYPAWPAPGRGSPRRRSAAPGLRSTPPAGAAGDGVPVPVAATAIGVYLVDLASGVAQARDQQLSTTEHIWYAPQTHFPAGSFFIHRPRTTCVMTRPPFDAIWLVHLIRLPMIVEDCPVCSSSRYAATGKFRVNANGKLLDVWLLTRCTNCNRTAKQPVLERVPVRNIPPAQLKQFTDNDPNLVTEILIKLATNVRKNRISLDWTGCWTVAQEPESSSTTGRLTVSVQLTDPIPLHPIPGNRGRLGHLARGSSTKDRAGRDPFK